MAASAALQTACFCCLLAIATASRYLVIQNQDVGPADSSETQNVYVLHTDEVAPSQTLSAVVESWRSGLLGLDQQQEYYDRMERQETLQELWDSVNARISCVYRLFHQLQAVSQLHGRAASQPYHPDEDSSYTTGQQRPELKVLPPLLLDYAVRQVVAETLERQDEQEQPTWAHHSWAVAPRTEQLAIDTDGPQLVEEIGESEYQYLLPAEPDYTSDDGYEPYENDLENYGEYYEDYDASVNQPWPFRQQPYQQVDAYSEPYTDGPVPLSEQELNVAALLDVLFGSSLSFADVSQNYPGSQEPLGMDEQGLEELFYYLYDGSADVDELQMLSLASLLESLQAEALVHADPQAVFDDPQISPALLAILQNENKVNHLSWDWRDSHGALNWGLAVLVGLLGAACAVLVGMAVSWLQLRRAVRLHNSIIAARAEIDGEEYVLMGPFDDEKQAAQLLQNVEADPKSQQCNLDVQYVVVSEKQADQVVDDKPAK